MPYAEEDDAEGRSEEAENEDEAQADAEAQAQDDAEEEDAAPPEGVPGAEEGIPLAEAHPMGPVDAIAMAVPAVMPLPVFNMGAKRPLLHEAAEEPEDLYPIINKKQKSGLLNVFYVELDRPGGAIIVTMELLAEENTEKLYVAVANKLPHEHFKLFEKSTGNILEHSAVSKDRGGTYIAVSIPQVNMKYHFLLQHEASDGKLTRIGFEIEQPYGTTLS